MMSEKLADLFPSAHATERDISTESPVSSSGALDDTMQVLEADAAFSMSNEGDRLLTDDLSIAPAPGVKRARGWLCLRVFLATSFAWIGLMTVVAQTSSIFSDVRVVNYALSKRVVETILNPAPSASNSPKLSDSVTAASASTGPANTTTSIPVFVGVLTAPTNNERRDAWRLHCAPTLRAAGIDAKFYIGRPSIDSRKSNGQHIQGQLATEAEQNLAIELYAEAEKYKDIIFIPFRDSYRDLVDKTLHIFDKGYQSGAQLVVKVDDDQCVNPKPLLDVAASRIYDAPNRMLYGGSYLWKGTEYDIMQGPHHEIATYFGGPTYVLSRKLVETILNDNAFTNLHAMYGSSSEDTDVGKWVQHVGRQHPEYTIDFKTFPIGSAVPKLRLLESKNILQNAI
eukprot:GEMP01035900.1.p1 GENE.GEMP01035900.1~~GEMP01035900.1.p1  ORF type:complete len:398 (+),score=68.66 GEMP01035900.1:111-1304(+)